jgi:hypothetical protein
MLRRNRKMASNSGTFGHTKWAEPVLVEGTGIPPRGEVMVDSNGKLVEEVAGRTQWYTQKTPIVTAVTYVYEESIEGSFSLPGPYPGDKYYLKLTADNYQTLESTIDIVEGSESVVIWSILPMREPAASSGDYSGSVMGDANGADTVELLDGNGDRRYLAYVNDGQYEIPDIELGHYILKASQGDLQQLQLLNIDGSLRVDIGAWPAGDKAVRGVVVDAITCEAVSANMKMVRYLSQRPALQNDDVTVYDGDTQVDVESVDAESGLVVLSETPSAVPTIIYHYLSGDTFSGNDMAVN